MVAKSRVTKNNTVLRLAIYINFIFFYLVERVALPNKEEELSEEQEEAGSKEKVHKKKKKKKKKNGPQHQRRFNKWWNVRECTLFELR